MLPHADMQVIQKRYTQRVTDQQLVVVSQNHVEQCSNRRREEKDKLAAGAWRGGKFWVTCNVTPATLMQPNNDSLIFRNVSERISLDTKWSFFDWALSDDSWLWPQTGSLWSWQDRTLSWVTFWTDSEENRAQRSVCQSSSETTAEGSKEQFLRLTMTV